MQAKLTSLLAVAIAAAPGCATTLFEAAERGDVAGVRALLREKPRMVDETDGRTLSALHYAASEGHTEVVRVLLDGGANARVSALGGMTPLFLAAAGGHAETTKLLVERGADTNARSPWNPLRVAAGEGHLEVVRTLLSLGADPEGHNIPPLMAAASSGHVAIMELLVKAGAKINRVTLDDFSSALTVAAARGQVEAVEWLVSHGANVNHDDMHGRTALMLAEENGHPTIVEMLRQHGAE
jgi:ankyrin repeat protein